MYLCEQLILMERCESMNISKMWILVIAVPLMLIIVIGGCWYMIIGKKRLKIVSQKTLNMYPIKNLEDLYEKEGYRDNEFEKEDKGTWILDSEMAVK